MSDPIQFTTLRGLKVTLDGPWIVQIDCMKPDGTPQSIRMTRDQIAELAQEIESK